MNGLVYYVNLVIIFDILVSYYYINLKSLIICCLFSRGVYISLGISLSCSIFSVSFATVPEMFCVEVLETFVVLSATLSQVKSPIASGVF